uniref:hypothetical protein n=1 Tax=Eubacterium cellulosolvens TaxID=29322 RepID=UPI0004817489|nr:hypothetical protein [[Eubacterium] cellulosolvens]
MMISPEGFISQHRKKSSEELLALRDDLFADIQRFEHKEISEDEWMIVKERIEADLFRRGTLWHDRTFLT